MNRAPDRKKSRREYLLWEGLTHVGLMARGLFLPMAAIAGTGCSVLTIIALGAGDLTTACYSAPLAVAGCCGVLFARQNLRNVRRMLSVPYVPPVTRDNHPAEETLVRGAEQRAAAAETLLRAAQSNEEAAPDQLLRVVPGTTGEQDR